MNLEKTSIKVEAYSIALETLKNLNHELEGAKDVSEHLVAGAKKLDNNLKGYVMIYLVTVIETFLSIIIFNNEKLSSACRYFLVFIFGLIVIFAKYIEEKLYKMSELINNANLVKKHIDSINVMLSDYTTSAEAKISNPNSGITV